MFLYEAPKQAVRSRTKSEFSVIPKVGDEKTNFCVQPITPTLRGILRVVLMMIILDLIFFYLGKVFLILALFCCK